MNTKGQALLDKWGIDTKEVAPYFDRELMKRLLDEYKENRGISSYRELATILGVSRSTLAHLKTTTAPLDTITAISYMDKMGINPKPYLCLRNNDEQETALEKWDIDLDDYEKQVDREVIVSLIQEHAANRGFKNLADLARDMGVAVSALREFMDNTVPVRSSVAVTYLDRLGIDPTPYLTPRNTERTPKNLRYKFLSTFKADEERDLMIKHADEIRLLLAKYKNA